MWKQYAYNIGLQFFDILYSQKIWQEIKFGGLAVGAETAKLKSANII